MNAEERYAAYNAFVQEQLADGVHHTIPHCDSRILHLERDCQYCRDAPELQKKRAELQIAPTGYEPKSYEVPCEADAKRPPGTGSDHRRWGGNKPTSAEGDEWPEETFASQVLYGPPGERRWRSVNEN